MGFVIGTDIGRVLAMVEGVFGSNSHADLAAAVVPEEDVRPVAASASVTANVPVVAASTVVRTTVVREVPGAASSVVPRLNALIGLVGNVVALLPSLQGQSQSPFPQQIGGNGTGLSAGFAVGQLANTAISNPSISGGSVSNATVAASSLSSANAANVGGDLAVGGNSTLTGNLTVGGILNAGTLNFSAASTSNLITQAATSTTFYSALANLASAAITNLSASVANVVGFTAVNGTTTNLYAGLAVIPTLSGTNATFAGNVGIGTTSPIAAFAVNGNSYLNGNLVISGSLSAGSLFPNTVYVANYTTDTTCAQDDTTAIAKAIAAAGSGGTVIFPADACLKISSTLTQLASQSWIGAGSQLSTSGNSTGGGTQINFNTPTGLAVTMTGDGASISHMSLYDSNSVSTSAVAIQMGNASTNPTSQQINDVTIYGFSTQIDLQSGAFYRISNFTLENATQYAIRIRNLYNADQGDGSIANGVLQNAIGTGVSALRIESGGGPKISNVKMLGFAYGTDVEVADGAVTSDLLLDNISSEAQTSDCARFGQLGPMNTGSWSYISFRAECAGNGIVVGPGIDGIQIGGVVNAAGAAYGVVISGGQDASVLDGTLIQNATTAGVEINDPAVNVMVGKYTCQYCGVNLKDNRIATSTSASTGVLLAAQAEIGTTTSSGILDVYSTTGAQVFFDSNQTQSAAAQLVLRGQSNLNQQLLLGYNTTSGYGSIQAINQGVAFKNLILAPAGGNVGIGTTTPYSRLTVWGPDTASTSAFAVVNNASTTVFSVFDNGNATYSGSIFQSSDQRLKNDVVVLDGSTSLSEIDALNPVSYNRIDQPGTGLNLGFIAQAVQQVFPELVSTTSPTVLTPDGTLTLNYTGLIAPMVAAIQQLSSEFASLAQSVTTQVITAVTGNFTTGHFSNQLCVGTTCVTPAQFQAMVAAANANRGTSGGVTSSTGGDASGSASSTAPVIQVNGANPAVITVGSSYNDLGATITGPQGDTNLGIATYLNRVLMSPLSVDTSQVATDTIDYVVTDQNGLMSTSTRTVIIQAAAAPSVAATSSATSTPQ